MSREAAAVMELTGHDVPDDELPAMAGSARFGALVDTGNVLSGLLLARERLAVSYEHRAALRSERPAVERRLGQVDPDARVEVDELLREWGRRVRAELDIRAGPS